MGRISHGTWRTKGSALIAAALAVAACSSGGAPSGGDEVTLHGLFMKQAAYSDEEVKAMSDAFTAANPKITIELEFVSYEALHDKIVTDQVGGSGTYDTVLVDAIWPAEFAEAGLVRDITDKIPAEYTAGVFDSAFVGGAYKDKFYAVPWINDTEFLYYNKKMLADAGFSAPPKSWDELVEQARVLKDKGIVKYPYVGQWAQSELAICDWTSMAGGMGGATFFDDSGTPTFNSGGPLAALELMKQMMDDGLANPASLGYGSDDIKNVLIAGQAAFGLDWTYVNAAANDPEQSTVVGQIAIAPGIGGTDATASGVNGGMGIGITRSSKHPDEALKFALFLASQQMQETYPLNSLPMWKESFTKPELAKAAPELWSAAEVAFANMVNRPTVPYYTALSNALQVGIQKALTGQQTPQQALDDVAAQVPSMKTP
jgi:multiple sugar transport system substrate-binding protein